MTQTSTDRRCETCTHHLTQIQNEPCRTCLTEGSIRPRWAPRAQAAGEVTYAHAGQLLLTVHPGCTSEALRRASDFLRMLIEDLAN